MLLRTEPTHIGFPSCVDQNTKKVLSIASSCVEVTDDRRSGIQSFPIFSVSKEATETKMKRDGNVRRPTNQYQFSLSTSAFIDNLLLPF